MKLKTRLVISFCIIILLPITLMFGIMAGYYHVHSKAILKNYGVKSETTSIFDNSVLVMNQYTKSDYREMLRLSKNNPFRLEQESYLKAENRQLISKSSFLIFRKDNRIAFNGEKKLKEQKNSGKKQLTSAQWLKQLPEYGSANRESDTGYYYSYATESLMKQIDFTCTDGSQGSLFIVTSSSSVLPEVRQLSVELMILVIMVLAITAASMTIWVYRSMTRPIQKLQVATDNIKAGNLDFTIDYDSEDEIGDLCRNFEEMRKRLKESTEEKIRSEKENRVLISNIAHDLKTPITAVKGYAEGIMDGVASTPEKMDKYIRTIYNKANEMDRLINELTLYSKIDTNRIPYNFHKINIADYFRDAIEEIGLELEADGIGLTYCNYAADDIRVIADPEQLMRVINNIISNAVKYMDPEKKKGQINIRIKDVGDFIQIEIEDNGQGIASKDLPYIFDRFYRTDASRNSRTGGSGIGLSIVKKIIEDHGGKIWATSKEHVGTTMYFVLRKYQEETNKDE